MPTVTVACKLPNGLVMELKPKEGVQRPIGRVEVRGNAAELLPVLNPKERRQSVQPFDPALVVPGGFALTPDVDEDFWNAWVEEYKNMEIVQQGIIYAMPRSGDARARSREYADLKTGLEGIDPDKPGPKLERVR